VTCPALLLLFRTTSTKREHPPRGNLMLHRSANATSMNRKRHHSNIPVGNSSPRTSNMSKRGLIFIPQIQL
jgi:hypothetical protein